MTEFDEHMNEIPQGTAPSEDFPGSTTDDTIFTTESGVAEKNETIADSSSAESANLPKNGTLEERPNTELEYGQPTEEVPALTPNETVIDEIASEDVPQKNSSNAAVNAEEELAGDGFTGITNVPEATAYLKLREKHDAGEELTEKDIDKIADLAVNYLRQILHCFGEDNTVIDEFEGDDGELILEITGGDLAILIGRHGNTLSALQQALNGYISKHVGFRYSLFVDIDGYREKRKTTVTSLAKKAAKRAVESQRDAELKPMNAYERRLVHIALKDDENVETFSSGDDPYRYVVVHPRNVTQKEGEEVVQTESTDTELAS